MRYEKEVAWKFSGDVQLAQQYQSRARVVAGELLAQNQLDLEQTTRRVWLADNVWCEVKFIFGQVVIKIEAGSPPTEEPEEKLAGFIVLTSDGQEGIIKWNARENRWEWVPKAELSELSYGNVVSYKDEDRAISCNAMSERNLAKNYIESGELFINGFALTETPFDEEWPAGPIVGGSYYEGRLFVVWMTWSGWDIVVSSKGTGGDWIHSIVLDGSTAGYDGIASAAVFNDAGSFGAVQLVNRISTGSYAKFALSITLDADGTATGQITHTDDRRYDYSYVYYRASSYDCVSDYYESDPSIAQHIISLNLSRDWYTADYSYCSEGCWADYDCWRETCWGAGGTIQFDHTETAIQTGTNTWGSAGPSPCTTTGVVKYRPEVYTCVGGTVGCQTNGWQGSVERYWYGGKEFRYTDCTNTYDSYDALTSGSNYLVVAEPNKSLFAGVSDYGYSNTGGSEYHSVYTYYNGWAYNREQAYAEGYWDDNYPPWYSMDCSGYFSSVNGAVAHIPNYTLFGTDTVYSCDNRRAINEQNAFRDYNYSYTYKVTAGTLGTVLNVTYTTNTDDVGSCYSRTEYDCSTGYEYCYGKAGCTGDLTEYNNSASFLDTWSSNGTAIVTIGYDARSGAWLRAECAFFREKTLNGGNGSPGTGSTKIMLRLPSGVDLTIATLPVAIAYVADQYESYDDAVSCSYSGPDYNNSCLYCDNQHRFGIYNGICTCVSECYPDYAPYTCGINNSGNSYDTDYLTMRMFPRYSMQTIYPYLSGGIIDKYTFQGNADILNPKFQCNQDTFGHWMVSVYLEIQEYVVYNYYYYLPVGDPILVTYNHLDAYAGDPKEIMDISETPTTPAYFENISVTGPRKK